MLEVHEITGRMKKGMSFGTEYLLPGGHIRVCFYRDIENDDQSDFEASSDFEAETGRQYGLGDRPVLITHFLLNDAYRKW